MIATCTTITVVQNAPNRSPEPAAFSLRSASWTLIRVIRSAGRIPTTAAPNSVSSAAYSTVFHDTLSVIQNGRASLPASRLNPQRSENFAMTSPSIAATAARTSASANSCVMMRPRLAPSAVRTAISQPRVAVRANTSVATFAHTTVSSIRKMPFAAFRMVPTKRPSPPSRIGVA